MRIGALILACGISGCAGGPSGHDADPAAEWIALLKEESVEVRREAAVALSEHPPEKVESLPPLLDAAKDTDGYVRALVIVAIGRMGAKAEPAVPALHEALKDPATRFAAAGALGNIGAASKPAVPDLIEAVKDEDPRVRSTAAWALGCIGTGAEEAIPTLEEAAKGSDADLRRAAADALISIRDRKGGPP
ncbi:MAG: HEAT repeat domain-containing protein [Planctomycetes bacterium]|nr:HEAT repeat domain-containing protein [Planctomycetota bacterium]